MSRRSNLASESVNRHSGNGESSAVAALGVRHGVAGNRRMKHCLTQRKLSLMASRILLKSTPPFNLCDRLRQTGSSWLGAHS